MLYQSHNHYREKCTQQKQRVLAEIKKEAVVQAVLEPMHEVGGDLYDYYSKGEDLFFIIGDVSGKGVPAAMFMSATVNLFRLAVLRLQSPKAILEEVSAAASCFPQNFVLNSDAFNSKFFTK